MQKAKFQGREVSLNNPFRLPDGANKKFGVYVKDGEKVKRVTFGDPNMEIRRDDDKARANFRARHSCDTATDKTSARYWSCRMWEKGATVSSLTKADAQAEMQIEKRAISEDVFTMREEAANRSMELGLGGATHVHELPTGQAVYMPGSSHNEYLLIMGKNITMPRNKTLSTAIQAIIGAVMGIEAKGVAETGIMKIDADQRVVFGWASVISEGGEPVIDTQGDIIEADELLKAANDFMMDARVAKAMHDGDQIGEVIHSLPLTKEIGDALGIQSDREGWVIAMKIHDDAVWKSVKSGELGAFSIGGKVLERIEVDG